MERPCAWKDYDEEQLDALHYLCEGYKAFISDNKTERECCDAAVRLAEEAGYEPLSARIAIGAPLVAGDKVYAVNRNKGVMLLHMGTQPLTAGLNILGAHIDSPRLDVKQNPVDEKNELVTLDTHYYGGIKKYQWVTMPLAIHGVVALKDGSVVNVAVGEDESDPVFCITARSPSRATNPRSPSSRCCSTSSPRSTAWTRRTSSPPSSRSCLRAPRATWASTAP